MGGLIIIIPCYNEFSRIQKDRFINFLGEDNDCKVVFSDDGSTDNTIQVLKEIQSAAPCKVFINRLEENAGKAEAVRDGVLYCRRNDLESDKIAYLDADLATSLEECLSISNLIDGNVVFTFGSRIAKIDNNIKRKRYRHLIGRVIATFISMMLGVTVYDTQCGCKVLERELAYVVFKDRFISKWLFDVEIFYRIIVLYGRDKLKLIAREVPLKSWIDAADSKVSFSYSLKIWIDMYNIYRQYNEKSKVKH